MGGLSAPSHDRHSREMESGIRSVAGGYAQFSFWLWTTALCNPTYAGYLTDSSPFGEGHVRGLNPVPDVMIIGLLPPPCQVETLV